MKFKNLIKTENRENKPYDKKTIKSGLNFKKSNSKTRQNCFLDKIKTQKINSLKNVFEIKKNSRKP